MIKRPAILNQAEHEFDRASGRMISEFRTMIADSEELLEVASALSGEGFSAARSKFQDRISRAKAALTNVSQPLFERTRETTAAADYFVRHNPWTAVGVGIGAGLLIGFMAAKRQVT